MLCSGEEEMGIVPPPNEWPQRMMGESSSTGTVERPHGSDHHNTVTGPLKCPRCDSTNTKFCYYNNYSLSQPRHFCKACKRYWTRGGTLRNVPVGGGCRKNKRVKKTTTSSSPPAVVPSQLTLPIPTQIDVRPTDLNPLFYDMGNLTFPSLRHRLDPNISIYDLQPQLNLNAVDLGFPPPHHQNNDNYQLQQSASSSLLHDYPLFGSSFSSATAASLLVSSLKQPKKMEDYQALLHYQDLNGNLGLTKEIKVEGEANATTNGNMIEWQVPCENDNPFETMAHTSASTGPVDPSFMYWNGSIGIAWPDATNC